MTEWPNEASDWRGLGWPWPGHYLGDRTKDRPTTGLWVQGSTELPEYQDRPDVFSGLHPPGKDAEPLRQGALAPKLLPLQSHFHGHTLKLITSNSIIFEIIVSDFLLFFDLHLLCQLTLNTPLQQFNIIEITDSLSTLYIFLCTLLFHFFS